MTSGATTATSAGWDVKKAGTLADYRPSSCAWGHKRAASQPHIRASFAGNSGRFEVTRMSGGIIFVPLVETITITVPRVGTLAGSPISGPSRDLSSRVVETDRSPSKLVGRQFDPVYKDRTHPPLARSLSRAPMLFNKGDPERRPLQSPLR